MICLAKPSVLCVVLCAILVSVTCNTLPTCKPLRGSLYVPAPACKQFVKLLEDPQFCNLDQAQNCCVLVDAAVTNHCHCWQGFSSATLGLLELLHKHCTEHQQAESTQQSEINVFIGVLTGSANAQQRQAGGKTYMQQQFIDKPIDCLHQCRGVLHRLRLLCCYF